MPGCAPAGLHADGPLEAASVPRVPIEVEVSLDVAVHRDERYTSNSGGPGRELVHTFVGTIPMAVTWSLMLSIAFLLLRTWRRLRHRHNLAGCPRLSVSR